MPNSVKLLKKLGWNVQVEHGAGTGAKFRDRDYETAGAEIVSKENVFASGLLFIFFNKYLHSVELCSDSSTRRLYSFKLPRLNR